jgi:hypothetical protein
MQMKQIFDTYGGIIHQPLDDMFVLAINRLIGNMTIKMMSFFMDGKFVLTSQVEGVQIYNPLMNNTKGPSNPYIMLFIHSNRFHQNKD